MAPSTGTFDREAFLEKLKSYYILKKVPFVGAVPVLKGIFYLILFCTLLCQVHDYLELKGYL